MYGFAQGRSPTPMVKTARQAWAGTIPNEVVVRGRKHHCRLVVGGFTTWLLRGLEVLREYKPLQPQW